MARCLLLWLLLALYTHSLTCGLGCHPEVVQIVTVTVSMRGIDFVTVTVDLLLLLQALVRLTATGACGG